MEPLGERCWCLCPAPVPRWRCDAGSASSRESGAGGGAEVALPEPSMGGARPCQGMGEAGLGVLSRPCLSPQTALHWAAKHGKEDMASLLVAAGADVNMRAGVSMQVPGKDRRTDLAAGSSGQIRQWLWATPPCTLPHCMGTARSWTCSSGATVPSRTCGITAGTWPGTT
ncbi:uncharacterized protein LOC144273342 isoform X3 [Eretmochelys imbricata]